jgi:hypothetical protein
MISESASEKKANIGNLNFTGGNVWIESDCYFLGLEDDDLINLILSLLNTYFYIC